MSRRAAWLLSAVVLVLGFLGAAPAARADQLCSSSATGSSCSIGLTVTNTSNGSLASGGNYGTINLSVSGDTVTFTITMSTDYGIHNNGFAFDYNGAAGALTLSSCTLTSPGSPGCTSLEATPPPQNFDGFGGFDYAVGITGTSGQAQDPTKMVIVLTTAGPTAPTLADFIIGNGKYAGYDNYFAAQIAYIPSTGCTAFAGNTGSYGGTTSSNSSCGPVSTPEPATGGMLSMGLIGIGGVGLIWRRRREIAA